MNATKNASMTIPAPNQWAKPMSRPSPAMRDSNVIELTTEADFNNPLGCCCASLAFTSSFNACLTPCRVTHSADCNRSPLDLRWAAPNNTALFRASARFQIP